jgi:hypothetical protein
MRTACNVGSRAESSPASVEGDSSLAVSQEYETRLALPSAEMAKK